MQIMGHRGAAAIAPENTLEGFTKALELGVDWIELDVHLSKDDVVIVIHDKSTRRIAEKNIKISDSTFDEINNLKTLSGYKIPKLQEVLNLAAGRCKINIELKAPGTAKKVIGLIEPLIAGGISYDNFMISSFNSTYLAETYNTNPKIRLCLLHSVLPFTFLFIKKIPLFAVGFHYKFLTSGIIHLAQKRGLFTYVYTVNKNEISKKLERWGAEAICTDNPDSVR